MKAGAAIPSDGKVACALKAPFSTTYLVSHGWHAGIVVKRADIPAGIRPRHNEFPEAEYLEGAGATRILNQARRLRLRPDWKPGSLASKTLSEALVMQPAIKIRSGP